MSLFYSSFFYSFTHSFIPLFTKTKLIGHLLHVWHYLRQRKSGYLFTSSCQIKYVGCCPFGWPFPHKYMLLLLGSEVVTCPEATIVSGREGGILVLPTSLNSSHDLIWVCHILSTVLESLILAFFWILPSLLSNTSKNLPEKNVS